MKERPILFSPPMVAAILNEQKWQTRRIVKNQPANDQIPVDDLRCPYGQPGDRLWVRETWAATDNDGLGITYLYKADGDDTGNPAIRWQPSIFMPRTASRLTLELTSVRVERLQDISASDCRAEGLRPDDELSLLWRDNIRDKYRILWNSLNAKRGYGWDVNPWVWVLAFEVTR